MSSSESVRGECTLLRAIAPSFHPKKNLRFVPPPAQQSSYSAVVAAAVASTPKGVPGVAKKSLSSAALCSPPAAAKSGKQLLRGGSSEATDESVGQLPKDGAKKPPPTFNTTHLIVPPPRWYSARAKNAAEPSAPATLTSLTPYAFNADGLSSELSDFVDFISLNKDEEMSRMALIDDVTACVRSLWPVDSSVFVYGSLALGLSLPSSDIDLSVQFGPQYDAVRSGDGSSTWLLGNLHRLGAKLAESHRLHIHVIDQCRVPVIHVQDTWSGISCDISMTLPYIDRVVAKQKLWLETHPLARPLIMVTKAALKQWGMNSSFTGGLSSTCVYLLVKRFLDESCSDAAKDEDAEVAATCCQDRGSSTTSSVAGGNVVDCSTTPDGESSSLCGLSSPSSQTEDTMDGAFFPSNLFIGPQHEEHGGAIASRPVGLPHAKDDAERRSSLSLLLLDLWTYCGHEGFSCGYLLDDAFLPDDIDRTCADLSRSAFRLSEIQFLMRHSAQTLTQLMRGAEPNRARWGSSTPPTLLSSVLTDPRQVRSTKRRAHESHF